MNPDWMEKAKVRRRHGCDKHTRPDAVDEEGERGFRGGEKKANHKQML